MVSVIERRRIDCEEEEEGECCLQGETRTLSTRAERAGNQSPRTGRGWAITHCSFQYVREKSTVNPLDYCPQDSGFRMTKPPVKKNRRGLARRRFYLQIIHGCHWLNRNGVQDPDNFNPRHTLVNPRGRHGNFLETDIRNLNSSDPTSHPHPSDGVPTTLRQEGCIVIVGRTGSYASWARHEHSPTKDPNFGAYTKTTSEIFVHARLVDPRTAMGSPSGSNTFYKSN